MIHFTLTARREIRRMCDRQSISNPKIRLEIQSGGCLGWYYRLSLTEDTQTNESTYRDNDLCVFIESDSQAYVQGLTVDYSEDLMGGGFRFQNPNATQTCSCSNSFSILPVGADDANETKVV